MLQALKEFKKEVFETGKEGSSALGFSVINLLMPPAASFSVTQSFCKLSQVNGVSDLYSQSERRTVI